MWSTFMLNGSGVRLENMSSRWAVSRGLLWDDGRCTSHRKQYIVTLHTDTATGSDLAPY